MQLCCMYVLRSLHTNVTNNGLLKLACADLQLYEISIDTLNVHAMLLTCSAGIFSAKSITAYLSVLSQYSDEM